MSDISVSVLKNWHHHKYQALEDAVAADYRDNKLSLREISKKYGIPSDATVIKILDRKGVERRSISEGLRLRREKKWLRRVRRKDPGNGTIKELKEATE